MIRNFFSTLLAITLLLSASAQATTQLTDLFSQQNKFLPQNQAFKYSVEQQDNRIIIHWIIQDGYYLYKNKFKFSSLTTQISEINLPQGQAHVDEYFGQQEVYYQALSLAFTIDNTVKDHEIKIKYQGCADAGLCYPPSDISVFFDPALMSLQDTDTANVHPLSEQQQFAQWLNQESLLWTIIIFIGLGIGLAFTPCVFPMYPILSGIIVGAGKQITSRHAFLLSFVYVQGMALTYSALGLIVASLGLQFQAAFQHPVVLGSLALLFTILSASMFGLINLQIPTHWTEKLHALSNRQQGGKLAGVFIMGMISGLVASPCTTAPLSGVLIYVAQSGDLLLGGITLYALSLGMGVPLMLMGGSGGKLLPKAGIWMDAVKGTFGFMLLAVVIVLLSRFISELWVNMAWSILIISLGGYWLHYNQLTQHNGFKSARHLLLLVMIIIATLFTLKPWLQPTVSEDNISEPAASPVEFIKIKGYQELLVQLELAKAAGKPVLLDFYADWCIACKDFEHKTFADPMIKPLLAQMVLLQTDVTANDQLDIEIQDNMKVLGLPTIILFDQQGKQLRHNRVVGFQDPSQFKQTLDLVL